MCVYMHVVYNYEILCYLVHVSPCVENGEHSLTEQSMLCTLLSIYYIGKVVVYCPKCSSCSKLLNSVYALTWYSSLWYLISLLLFTSFHNISSEAGGWGKQEKVRNTEADAHIKSKESVNLRYLLAFSWRVYNSEHHWRSCSNHTECICKLRTENKAQQCFIFQHITFVIHYSSSTSVGKKFVIKYWCRALTYFAI